NQAKRDDYVYDLRNYPRGFSEQAVKELWDSDFKPREGEIFNSGHFRYIIPLFKKQGGTFEELWNVMKDAYKPAWEKLGQYEENYTEYYWSRALERAKNYLEVPDWVKKKKGTLDEPKPVEKYRAEERRAFEHWKDYALKTWKSANEYRKALGKPLLPKPEWSDTSFEQACRIVIEEIRKDFEKKFSEFNNLEKEMSAKKTSSTESAEGSISLPGKLENELLDRNGNTESGVADADTEKKESESREPERENRRIGVG
ncbi:MAG: hypothetical protein QME47_05980, partial [Candidatus Thermoplasmatota archaeon]|nr:hypothetical protein [Candidatus Thermoplasmatota archaeon]